MKIIFRGCVVLGAIFMIFAFISRVLLEKTVSPTLPVFGVSILTVGIVGLTVGGLILGNLQSSKLIKNGILTVGEIVSSRPTGLRVNGQPQVEIKIKFTLKNGTEIESELKTVLLFTDLAHAIPGVLLAIRYDEDDPKKIAIDNRASQSESQAAYDKIAIKKGLVDPELLEISKNGLKGTGVLMKSKPTGKIKENRVEMKLKIMVTPEKGEPYETEFERYFSQPLIPQLYAGAVFEVYYLPSDPYKISIKLKAV